MVAANTTVLKYCSKHFIFIITLYGEYCDRLFHRCGNGDTGWVSILLKTTERPGALHHVIAGCLYSALLRKGRGMQMKTTEGRGVAQTLKKNKITFLSAFATTYLLFSQFLGFS